MTTTDTPAPTDTASTTTTLNTEITVVDGGTEWLKTYTDDTTGEEKRIQHKATYDPTTRTITVRRDHERPRIGADTLPEVPPLTDHNRTFIVAGLMEHILNGEKKFCEGASVTFYETTDSLEKQKAQARANIRHPEWCDQTACEVDSMQAYHNSGIIGEHEWVHDYAGNQFSAVLKRYSEDAVLDDSLDSEWLQIDLTPVDGEEAYLIGSPAHFRELGRWLIEQANAADRLIHTP